MKDVPTIGGARGVFEIFVPGVFLLVNIVGAIYLFPWISGEVIGGLNRLSANTAAAIVITVCFGYLCGVVLRLQRADLADNASAWWIRRFNPRAKRPEGTPDLYWSWATDEVPFIRWIGEMCEIYLPSEAKQYYSKEWGCRLRDRQSLTKSKQNKQFLNLCKVAISKDRSLAAEVYTAEALTRYVVCMFYALVIASVLAASTAVLNLASGIAGKASFAAATGAGITCCAYLLATWLIVKNLRFVRIKEVETLFYACYVKNLRMSDLHLEGGDLPPRVSPNPKDVLRP
jgi:hypothetical protein